MSTLPAAAHILKTVPKTAKIAPFSNGYVYFSNGWLCFPISAIDFPIDADFNEVPAGGRYEVIRFAHYEVLQFSLQYEVK